MRIPTFPWWLTATDGKNVTFITLELTREDVPVLTAEDTQRTMGEMEKYVTDTTYRKLPDKIIVIDSLSYETISVYDEDERDKFSPQVTDETNKNKDPYWRRLQKDRAQKRSKGKRRE